MHSYNASVFLFKLASMVPDKLKRRRIILADSQARVRFALRILLEQVPAWKIVGEAVDADDLLRQLEDTDSDLVLLEWKLPGLKDGHSLAVLRKARPGVRVIALSGRPEFQRSALEAGANDFVSKADPPDRLIAAIRGCD